MYLMIMFSPHKPRFVLKQCNNHDKITCVDRLEENPRLCSKQQSKNGAFPERTARSQQYAGHGERRKRHTRHNHDVFSVQRTTAIVRTILLLSIFALLAECRELPQPSVRNLEPQRIPRIRHNIKPTVHDGQNKREIIDSTRQTDGQHLPHIILDYTHDGRRIVADLYLNTHLLGDRHFLRSQSANGSPVVRHFNRNNVDLCHYQGRIRGSIDSKIALSTCNGLNGIIHDGFETFFIHSNETNKLNGPHIVLSQSEVAELHPVSENAVHDSPMVLPDEGKIRIKRATNNKPIQEPYNANAQSSYVELVLVIDNDIYKGMNSNLDGVHKYSKDIANIINSLYAPLNIFVALVGVIVWTEQNEIELSHNGDTTLTNFLSYRRKMLNVEHPNDNAQLLTKTVFDNGVVGKALKGPMCTYEFSGGVSSDHSTTLSVVATTIAHEMGHNFGMEHDADDCECADDRCIMSASSSSVPPTRWSKCSIDQLNLSVHHGMSYCLKSLPRTLFESPTCGNGFVEAGEECDCGLPGFCENSCCDPVTCRLRSNATCATGKCCDLTTCQPHAAGFECRAAAGECDLPEYCNGDNEACPIDFYKRDTEPCDDGSTYCYRGMCKSRDKQCELLWGLTGRSSEQCYDKNLEASRHGNCGYDRVTKTYRNCTAENVRCGLLQCRHLNERLEFGMESVAILSHSFVSYMGSIIPCRTALIDLGLQSKEPGLVPDGSKCGDEKLCIDQVCTSISTMAIKKCDDNCNGHGVCDNTGNCHCDKGFAPPLCNSPGPGGSIRSGPASDPDHGSGFMRILYIFFLGVVPFISISLFLMYYWHQNRPWFISQPPVNDLKVSVRHYPSRPPPPAPSSGHSAQRAQATTDDAATLLKANATRDTMKRELFGNFKGFSLKPLPMSKPNIAAASNVAYVQPVSKSPETTSTQSSQCLPSRAAPLPPSTLPTTHKASTVTAKLPVATASTTHRYENGTDSPETPIEVKLFANPEKDRPKISHPVLENSTCSVKEMVTAVNRANTLNPKQTRPSEPIKSTVVETVASKTLVKSTPSKAVTFNRSHSMRGSNDTSKPKLSSGSMRLPNNVQRKNSVVDRPKNPPPPRPLAPNVTKFTPSQEYANDDDINKAANSLDNSTDNIYCVIADVKEEAEVSLSNGLLSEIVNEIENRNNTSIYSTSKKLTKQQSDSNGQPESIYQNLQTKTDSEEPAAENIYMNTMKKSSKPPNEQNNVSGPKTAPPPPKVNSVTKKFGPIANGVAGDKAKPLIASKPAGSHSKAAIGYSRSDASKSPSAKSNASNSSVKPSNRTAATNLTSSVRSLHKKFESFQK